MSAPRASLRRRHQLTFLAAGAWNLAWGLRTALQPETFYRTAGLPPAGRPEVAACLGMVVGLYGVLYLDVARRPDRGGPIAAVGLAGKVLGPAGLALAVAQGRWPARAFLLTVGNDLVWWWPFARYLHDVTRAGAQTGRPAS